MNTEQITEYIFIEDEDLKGDIALIFGTGPSFKLAVEKVAELYKKSLIPKIILSGGVNIYTGFVEGDTMANELINLGIPKKDILIENKSLNTLENVLFSKEIIEKEIGLENIKTIVAVVKNYHSRRCLMTLRKHFPKHIKLKSAVYPSIWVPSKENWHLSDISKQTVMEEVEKIDKYLKKGDIIEI